MTADQLANLKPGDTVYYSPHYTTAQAPPHLTPEANILEVGEDFVSVTYEDNLGQAGYNESSAFDRKHFARIFFTTRLGALEKALSDAVKAKNFAIRAVDNLTAAVAREMEVETDAKSQ